MLSLAHSCRRATARRGLGNRGGALAAAVALTFLLFAITLLSLARVAGSYTHVSLHHKQTTALFLAEAGIRKAALRLAQDATYAGEQGTRLPTGTFDVSVTPIDRVWVVTSTGCADTPFKTKPRKTVRATVTLAGGGFRIGDWREDP